MNLSLLDPFGQDFPDHIQSAITSPFATIAVFNGVGTLLAGCFEFTLVGCATGLIFIYDLYTLETSFRQFKGHVEPISGLSWSKNSRFLLSSSYDYTCVVWDLLNDSKTVYCVSSAITVKTRE